MFLAEEVVESTAKFFGFDLFVIIFTVLIAAGVFGLLKQRKKNLFAIGFGVVSLLVFLLMDVVMVAGWFGVQLSLLPKF